MAFMAQMARKPMHRQSHQERRAAGLPPGMNSRPDRSNPFKRVWCASLGLQPLAEMPFANLDTLPQRGKLLPNMNAVTVNFPVPAPASDSPHGLSAA
jgi:hypothetical protein